MELTVYEILQHLLYITSSQVHLFSFKIDR